MHFNIPWINTRRRLLFAVFIDGLINILFYSLAYSKNFNANPNFLIPFSLAAFWIILSYIFGRYMILKKINFKEINKIILKAFTIFLICNLIYLTLNWSNKFLLFLAGNSYEIINIKQFQHVFFMKITLFITIFSCFTQYCLSFFTYKIYSPNKYWLFYGSRNDLIDFKREIIDLKNNLQLKRIDSKSNLNKYIYEKIEGIIVGKKIELNEKDIDKLFFLKSQGFKIINVLSWCENQLHRIPPYMISNKINIIDKFNSFDDSYSLRIKRIGDFIVSLFLLLITLPINLIIAILIYIEDRGPIFYSQIRTGFRGKKISAANEY